MARGVTLRRRRGPRRRGGRRLKELLERAYAAFNERDVDAALQFGLIDSRIEPVECEELPDGRLSVRVEQRVRDLSGRLLSESEVRHVYMFRDGLIRRMDIEE